LSLRESALFVCGVAGRLQDRSGASWPAANGEITETAFPIRRLIIIVAMGTALAAPSAASALTSQQAQQAVATKLAQVYGSAWLRHTPTWSEPECRQPIVPQAFVCSTEFQYAGVWHAVGASVNGGTLTLCIGSSWVRRWQRNSTSCTRPSGVVGELFTNGHGCDASTLYQNFGYSPGTHRVRYTGFKRHVFYYGTDTALWPDFYGYSCSWSHATYQCTNRFGDGFRWKPYAGPAGSPGTRPTPSCSNQTLTVFGKPTPLRFVLHGNVTCTAAHSVM
jgi:hypothetical protein